jgi:hypothetical protein
MYDISFCVKRKDLSQEEYNHIRKYMDRISHKDYNDGDDGIENIHLTQNYVFGTIDRNDTLYDYLNIRKIKELEWNE